MHMETFIKLDKHFNGRLTFKEFLLDCNAETKSPNRSLLKRAFQLLDIDDDREITFHQYLMFALTMRPDIEDKARVAKNVDPVNASECAKRVARQTRFVFRILDLDDTGSFHVRIHNIC